MNDNFYYLSRRLLCSLKPLSIFIVLIAVTLYSEATTYYSTSFGVASTTSTWGTSTNGSGTHPVNFNTASDVFISQGTILVTSSWTIAGTLQVNSSTITVSASAQAGNVIISGGTLSLAGGNLTVNSGAFTYNSGTFSGLANTVSFTGTSTLGGLSSPSFGKLQISSGTLTASSNFSVVTSFINNGNFIASAGTATFTGTPSISGTGVSAFNNITVSTISTLSLSQDITVTGNFTNNGTLSAGTSTVTFNNTSSAQTINGSATSQSFYNITVNKSAQALSISGSTITLNVAGTLTLSSGTFTAGTATNINMTGNGGNWINNGGTFTPGSGTVTFNNNAGPQTISGTATSQNFNNLTVTKTSQALALSGSIATLSITSILNLSSGTISTGSGKVAIASGGSVTRTSGWVNGNLQKNIAAAATINFEVGDAVSYTPASLVISATGFAAGDLLVAAKAPLSSEAGISILSLNQSLNKLNRYWQVTTPNTFTGSYTGTFTYIASDLTGSNTALRIGVYNGTSWIYPGAATAGTLQVITPAGIKPGDIVFAGPTSLTASLTGSVSKVYNSTTTALLTSGNYSLATVLNGNTVIVTNTSGTYNTKNAGTGKTVTVTNLLLGGNDAGAYSLSNASSVNGTVGIITPLALNITASTNIKTYDASVDAAAIPAITSGILQGSDVANFSEVYDTKNAGTSKILTALGSVTDGNAGGNYTYTFITNNTGVINPLSLNLTGSKMFDGTAIFSGSQLSSSNILGSDVVTFGGSATTSGSATGTYTSFVTNNLTSSNTDYSVTGGTVSVSITACTTDYWIGAANGDWNMGTNWSCSVPPSPTTDAVVPAGSSPILSVDVIVNSLSIAGSSTVSINGHTLTINGTISGTGTLTGSSTSNLTIGGAAGTVNFTSGSGILDNLTLNSGATATLGTALDITAGSTPGTVTVASGATLTTGGNLTIKSDANGTASVGTSAGTISGNVTVERYIPNDGSRAWRILSTATNSALTIQSSWQAATQITTSVAGNLTNGFDAVTPYTSMQTYQQSSNSWIDITSTKVPLSGAAAYSIYIRGDRSATPTNTTVTATTLSSTGALYQGNITTTIASGSFGIVGNQYASAIDFTQLSKSNINPDVYYVWDPKLIMGSSLGSYQAINHTSSNNTWYAFPGGASYPSSSTTISPRVESGQAFFVATTASPASVTLTEGSKVSGSNMVFRPQTPAGSAGLLRTNFYDLSSGAAALQAANQVVFSDLYSDAIDNNDIARLGLTAGQESLDILRNGKLLMIEGRQPVVSTDTIFFNAQGLKQHPYKLEFLPSDFGAAALTAYLQDNYLGTKTAVSLSAASTVQFSVDANAASAAANRFEVVFSTSTPVPVRFTGITAVQQGAGVLVSWQSAGENGIAQYVVEHSTDGTTFSKIATAAAKNNNGGAASYSYTDAAASTGTNYYRVYSVGVNGGLNYTQVVSVTAAAQQPSIAVYPNPVSDGHIHIALTNEPKGSYSVRLLNAAGQLVYTATLTHGGGTAAKGLELPAVSQGVYQLEILTPAKETHIEKLTIK